jgi:hypothetical protein
LVAVLAAADFSLHFVGERAPADNKNYLAGGYSIKAVIPSGNLSATRLTSTAISPERGSPRRNFLCWRRSTGIFVVSVIQATLVPA